jgi:xanthine/uracil permease
MKKRMVKKSGKSKNIGLSVFIIFLLLLAFATAFWFDDYSGVAIGVLIGFLIYFLLNRMK